MSDRILLSILTIIMLLAVVLAARGGVIGVRGGSLHRSEHPVLFWTIVIGTLIIAVAAIILIIV